MKTRSLVLLAILSVFEAPRLADAGDGAPASAVGFNRDIRPILSDKCFACHGPDQNKRKANLRLDTREGATADRGGYAAVVPGNPEESELIARINAEDDDSVMPPRGHPKTLEGREKELLERWVRQGAGYEGHWAYVRPVRPPLPAVRDSSWPRQAIDVFVLAGLEGQGLTPTPEAPRATLIRRLSLDLTGLPPTPAEVASFEADRSEPAYEKLVDRLLASPEFGERWARPWLDLARYADSHGFQRDDLRETWAYRDWVIRALNRDMPFDQFTIEQVAGDLLPDATAEQTVATGFHRCTPTNVEAGSEPEESRINQVIDRVNTTGAVWLGATLECARCHDHKFDPIAQKEYYRLLAFFNNTESEVERANPKVPSSIRFRGPALTLEDEATRPLRTRLQGEIARLDGAIKALADQAVLEQADWEAEARERLDQPAGTETGDGTSGKALPPRIAVILKLSASRRNAQQHRTLSDFYLAQLPEMVRMKQARVRVAKEFAASKPASTQVMIEMASPRVSTVFNRGEYTDPGEPVEAGVPAVLHPLPVGAPNRLTLARWLVARENPLTARVTVNRWWGELFGRSIVPTPEDFGMQGEPPSHPELLDWLAVEFMENGWSMKGLLREIVLSATYRQSSRVTPDLLQRDPQNRWLARGPRFRMDAEMIRDNALAVAGLLHLKKGGPPIRPPQPEGLWIKVGGERYDYDVSPGAEKYRRGIYVVLKRAAPYPGLATFDATARLTCIVKRSRSNTPLQALTLLNDPVYVEAALALAARIVTETPGAAVEPRLEHAVRLCLARAPRPAEIVVLGALYEAQRRAALADDAAARTLARSSPLAAGIPDAEFASWYAVASTLMNLDETITKD